MKQSLINKTEKIKLSKFLMEQIKGLSYNQVRQMLRKKDIKINGNRTNDDCEIKCNDLIEIYLPEQKIVEKNVVYEDDNVLIVFKKAGIETTLKDKTFLNKPCLEEICSPFKAVHRLDRNTEGLVVLAKNEMSYNELLKAFKERRIEKFYTAIVLNKFNHDIIAEDYLVKDKDNSFVKIYSKEMPNSVLIKTGIYPIREIGEFMLVNVQLFTGKTHQIRAHLSHLNHAILGDEKYGDKQVNKINKTHRQFLCASKLIFKFDKKSCLFYLNGKSFEIEPTWLGGFN